MATHVLATSRVWNEYLATDLTQILGEKFVLINRKEDLTYDRLKKINPVFVFFPHWSYIVPSDIYNSFECVIFHMTDVPFGRGGSPLQNLIARGIYDTKLTALRCTAEVDGGPVYMKVPLSLHGVAEEIYLRAARQTKEMIRTIITQKLVPIAQEGEVTSFPRRKPEDGDIAPLSDLEKIFDYIRMLDSEGYPKAFLETDHIRIEFERPVLRFGRIVADVTIRKKVTS